MIYQCHWLCKFTGIVILKCQYRLDGTFTRYSCLSGYFSPHTLWWSFTYVYLANQHVLVSSDNSHQQARMYNALYSNCHSDINRTCIYWVFAFFFAITCAWRWWMVDRHVLIAYSLVASLDAYHFDKWIT